jgi:cell wall-associated NlpC family hydrolase
MAKRILLLMSMIVAAMPACPDAADAIVDEARQSLGIRYGYGKSGARATDCAALARKAAAAGGVELPRTTREQYRVGEPVPREELAPGDLVFFRNTYRVGISHVGIYIGEGKFVHAASRQRSVVINELDEPYFAKRFAGGRRIVEREPEEIPLEKCAVP